jgi:anthranilate phosphoribosyltransferase
MINEAIRKIVDRVDLSRQETHDLFSELMDGQANDVQKSALLVGLKMKGEAVAEIIGAAEAMRSRVIPVTTTARELVDTCGTGGDGRGTFNVSTVAALVAAGAGVRVAKHGNRAVSSRCGSADLLDALGVDITLEPSRMSAILEEVGIAFLFAPVLHPAMAAVIGVRRELGVRTIFNVLGPITNPAFAKRQVLGVFSPALVSPMAQALHALGSEHVLVVHGRDGIDEISVCSETDICEVRDGQVLPVTLSPEGMGLQRWQHDSIPGGDVETNVDIALSILDGAAGAARDLVLANAGAAIYVSGRARTIVEGVEAARESIDSGSALRKLNALVDATNRRAA